MFNKLLARIEFADVEEFCREWGEGIRVEYKRDLIKEIPKTVSAFANTLGGILVMGVAADQNTNKAIFPIEGMAEAPGLEERVIQSSQTGVYPGVLPEVRVLSVPNQSGKVVAVVKVHESPEAPHAIQNSTRVYVRTGSLSQPYELAEIDRIEYLLKRREQPQKFRDELIAKSDARFSEHIAKEFRDQPCVAVEVARLFPREPILSAEALYEFAASRHPADRDRTTDYFMDRVKRIPNGVFSIGHRNTLPYAELSTYGVVLTRSQLDLGPSSWTPNKGILFVRPPNVIWTLGRSLRFAGKFFERANFSGAVRVLVRFVNVLHQPLQYSGHESDDLEYACSDREFSVQEVTTTEALRAELAELVHAIARQAFWAFNCDYENADGVRQLLANERLLASTG